MSQYLFEQIKSGKLPRAIENQTVYQLELPIPHNLPKPNNILVGRKNEIETLNGTLVKFAKELNIPVPVNELIYKTIKNG